MESRNFPIDRISDLPDSLLTKILSLLPAEEVVRTGKLSTRWVRLWASVPVLVFDDHKLDNWQLSEEEFIRRDRKFIAFVKFVLEYREPLPLDTFKFKWCTEFSCAHRYVSKLLHHAMKYKPRVLSINIDIGRSTLDLPDSIFRCASIEEMSLLVENTDLSDHFIEPKSINLPSLNKLELGFLKINDYFMRMLLSGCPALEELVMDSCYLFVNEISSPVLKKLALKEYIQFTEMQISCPDLVSLEINSCNTKAITLKNLSSLATAHIYFEDVSGPYNHDLKLLGGLSNVTTLKLSTICPDVLDLLAADIPNCGTFKNLKDFELGELDVNLDWKLVPSEVESEEDPLGEVAFQREYLETVVITCPWRNNELAGVVVKMLETLIKTIGNTIVLVDVY